MSALRKLTTVFLLFLLLACQPRLAPSPTAALSTPAPLADAPPEIRPPAASSRPADLVPDPFPVATTTVAGGQALLWSPWPMEGRDPQRTGRVPSAGPAQPRLYWEAPIETPSFGQPVFAADGSVYLGTAGGNLLAFSADGKPAWSFSTTGPIPTPAVGPEGAVYSRSGDGSLFTLHPDGRRRWTADIGAPPARLGPAPIVGPDRYSYLASYHSGIVYFVQPAGFFQWAYNAKARTLAGVAVGVDGLIYFGSADGMFRALDRDLVERWVFDAAAPVVSPPAIGPDGSVFFLVGTEPPHLFALDRDGRKLWSISACWAVGAPVVWPAVAADGRVQVANCAVERDGKVQWTAPISAPTATPAALDADGNAYFGSGHVLTAVSGDGRFRWSYTASGEVGPPSLGAFGTVAFTSTSADRLYLLRG